MSGPLSPSAGRRAAAVGLPLAAVAAAHIGPAVTWLPAVRRRLFPGLDGTGHPATSP